MRRNTAVNYDANGTYATDLFNDEAVRLIDSHNRSKPLFLVLTHLAPHTGNEDDPLQAPADEIAKFDYIQDPKRRTLAAMVSRIDTGVGRIYRSLERRRMLNNTIILFYADNGAPTLGIHANSGSNYPLRGQKESPWEGAVRGAALIWSRLLPRKGVVSNQWLHVSDWLPTLGHAAGIRIPPNNNPIDGQDQWSTLTSSSNSGRTVVMNNAHNEFTYSSYIKRGWKYVNGTSFKGAYDRWLGQLKDGEQISHEDYYKRLVASQSIGSSMLLTRDDVKRLRSKAMVECSSAQGTVCEPLKRPCLFNIVEDPCERNNQANAYPYILRELETDVNGYRKRSVPSRQQPSDSRADPARHNCTWTWWLEGLGTQSPTHNLQQLFSTFQSFMEYFMALFAKVEAKLLAKQKYSPWEGAVRGAALIWSPLLPRKRVVSEQWIHVSDWLPTLGHAAGIQSIPAGSPIDGQNQWLTLQSASVDGRTVVMHNVDRRYGYRSYMKQDPCERVNLADEYPELLKDLQSDAERFKRDALPPRNQPSDSRSDPALHNNTWTWWQDEMDEHMAPYILYLAAAVEILLILIVLWCGHKYCTRLRTKTEPKDAKLANK
uniref:Sulfatase N-terminal domain-containing protein n=1 Tax=Anopheles melas TaxID=34690 RepID=A0A182TTU5_9DIPT